MNKLTANQIAALKKILYTDNIFDINKNTLNALVRRGYINSVGQITCEGIAVVAPDAPKPVITAKMEEARKAQDELIQVIEKRGFDLAMRLSRDLPEDITGSSICRMIYPEHISEINRMITQLSK